MLLFFSWKALVMWQVFQTITNFTEFAIIIKYTKGFIYNLSLSTSNNLFTNPNPCNLNVFNACLFKGVVHIRCSTKWRLFKIFVKRGHLWRINVNFKQNILFFLSKCEEYFDETRVWDVVIIGKSSEIINFWRYFA